MNLDEARVDQAVKWLREADGILITAGAGMGVDSGLPDFRGANGFWKAYPALGAEQLNFQDIANGQAFLSTPERSWGFYGHRLQQYRTVVPHEGFRILKRWADSKPHGYFIYTSNVDGAFQKIGFEEDRIMECHGSIHHLQCAGSYDHGIWSADELQPEVNEAECLLLSSMPRCPACGEVARPNILMFEDYAWAEERTERQRAKLNLWLQTVQNKAVIELGAGKAISTVRKFSEYQKRRVIRINPDDHGINPKHGVGLAGRALEVLRLLDEKLNEAN